MRWVHIATYCCIAFQLTALNKRGRYWDHRLNLRRSTLKGVYLLLGSIDLMWNDDVNDFLSD
jgi:hypothetical protein